MLKQMKEESGAPVVDEKKDEKMKLGYVDRLLAAIRLSPSEKDELPRTGYTYLDTLSYTRNPKYRSESEWLVPIMSRRTTPRSSASGRSTGREREEENLARLPEQEQHLLVLDEERSNSEEKYKSGRESRVKTSTSRITSSSVRITTSSIVNGTTPTDLSAMNGGSSSGVSSDLILTRSQCVPGKCSAGCPLHHNRRKRKAKSRDDASTNTDSVAGDFDEHGLDVLSSDEEFINNDFKPNNFTTKTSSTPKSNGYGITTGPATGPVAASCSVASNRARRSLRFATGGGEDDVEEVTIVRRIRRIFNSSSSSSSSQVQQLIADLTPEPVQRISRQVTQVIPVPVILALLTLTSLTALWYFSLFPTTDPCQRVWDNLFYVSSFIKHSSISLFGISQSTCSGLVLVLKSSTVTIWSSIVTIWSSIVTIWSTLTSLFSFSPSRPKLIYSSMDDPPDAQTLARIEEALRVYGETLESLDSRLTDLKYEVTSNKENIALLKKSCCKDPRELEEVIHSSVRSFWIKMFPSLAHSSSDEQLRKEVQEHLSKIARDSASGVHGEHMGEFNDRFQRRLDEVTQTVLAQIQELKSRQQEVESRQQEVESRQQGIESRQEKVESGRKGERDVMDETITRSTIQRMITDAISMYDADKTGIPDFALEPSGGSVINTRCSETYSPQNRQYRVFGIPVWTTSTSPREVIQPSIAPGECWAFKGSEGHLVIKLSRRIIPTSFAYEHIPRSISRDGNIDSAPKLFQVRGLKDEFDKEGDILGNYEYSDNDTPLQSFDVQAYNPKSYNYIELIVKSNHGNQEYTCLYRFRVHGQRV